MKASRNLAHAAPDVLTMIRQIEARGALDISRRAKKCVGQVSQFAIASGWVKADPTTHLRGALKPMLKLKLNVNDVANAQEAEDIFIVPCLNLLE